MKNLFTLGAAVVLGALPIKSSAQAQNWTTVLDYQLRGRGGAIVADASGNVFADVGVVNNGQSESLVLATTTSDETRWYRSDEGANLAQGGLAFDSHGNLWSAEGLYDPSLPGYDWEVRMSSSPATTNSWHTMDRFQYGPDWSSTADSVAGDLWGNVYVAGGASVLGDVGDERSHHWLVRKGTFSSADQTWSWATVDDVGSSTPRGIAFVPPNSNLPNGAVFAVGYTYEASDEDVPLVRRSLDGGATWDTVDVFGPVGVFGPGAFDAYAVCSDASGDVYVVGSSQVSASNAHSEWLVRKSSDAGTTWQTADTYEFADGGSPSGIVMASAGNPVVVGDDHGSDGHWHWVVRRPANGAWTTIDYYPALGTGSDAVPWGVAADAAGNLLVTGRATDASGSHWLVRRLPPSIARAPSIAYNWNGSDHSLSLSIPTTAGASYALESTPSLSPAQWTPLSTLAGDGTAKAFPALSLTNQQGFYRVRIQ